MTSLRWFVGVAILLGSVSCGSDDDSVGPLSGTGGAHSQEAGKPDSDSGSGGVAGFAGKGAGGAGGVAGIGGSSGTGGSTAGAGGTATGGTAGEGGKGVGGAGGVAGSGGVPLTWHRGNVHTHSKESDGSGTPAEMAAIYEKLGYHFLVLTDHNKLTSFSGLSTSTFIALDGEEVSNGKGHVNALGLSQQIAVTSALTSQQMIDAILAQAGLPILNHPAWLSLPLQLTDLWLLEDVGLMEIYNHITDKGFEEQQWDGLLTAGKLLYGVAADDAHAAESAAHGAGYGWVVVRTKNLTAKEILGALSSGEFYASSGPEITDVSVSSTALQVKSNGEYIEFIGQGGKVLSSVVGGTGQYVFANSDRYVRARVTGPAGKAWTQPAVRGSFARDPYADSVVEAPGIAPASAAHLLGPPVPGRVPTAWDDYATRISAGQHVILDMGANEDIVDGDGPDLYVEEVDGEDAVGGAEPYVVSVSQDGTTWVLLGTGVGDSYFDLKKGSIASARYVKIEVTAGDVEIDGVVYLDPAMRDPQGDAVVDLDHTKITAGVAPHVLGPPYPGKVPADWQDYAVRVAAGGYLVIDLGPGEEILNLAGPDLHVEEVDAEDGVGGPDPYSVSVSEDGVTWVSLGDASGDADFNFPASVVAVRYVRLEVQAGDAEFDAVSGL